MRNKEAQWFYKYASVARQPPKNWYDRIQQGRAIAMNMTGLRTLNCLMGQLERLLDINE